MSAMKPIDTYEYPLDHEPIEDWQRVDSSAVAPGEGAAFGGASASNEGAAADDEDSVPRDQPTTAFAELGTIAGADYGLWEMSAGVMRDIEGEEVFLVISGTGRIEFDSPERASLELSPGTLVRLEEGMKTRWFIDEAPLRKLFIAPSED